MSRPAGSRAGDRPVSSPPLCTVLGAGPGLGAAIGRRFAAEGFRVALVTRSPHRLADWPAPDDEDVVVVRADLADQGTTRAALARVERWGGATDVLVHNVADMSPDEVLAMTTDRLLEAVRVDAGSLLDALAEVLPAMERRGRGTVLVTGGGLALEPYPDWAGLAAGKAALRSIALNLHKALAPRGVRVALVAVCGLVAPGGPLDPDLVAEEYWRLHAEPATAGRRELVLLPDGADPFYNDPGGVHRAFSQPIRPEA